MGLICRHTPSEFLDIVMTVPLRQLVEPGVHRIVLFDACRVDETVHVLVPRFQSQFHSPERHIVPYFFGQRLVGLVIAVSLSIFGHTSHEVLTHKEVRIEENLGPHGLDGLFRNTFQRFERMFLQIVFLQGNGIYRIKNVPYQYLVPAQYWMTECELLCLRHGDALVQTGCGHSHQQFHFPLFIRQFKITPQDIVHDEEPIEVISPVNRSSGHQTVTFLTDVDGFLLLRLFSVCQKSSCLWVEEHLRVGTQINRAIQSRLQVFDVHLELVLIGQPCRLVQIPMELPNLLFLLG